MTEMRADRDGSLHADPFPAFEDFDIQQFLGDENLAVRGTGGYHVWVGVQAQELYTFILAHRTDFAGAAFDRESPKFKWTPSVERVDQMAVIDQEKAGACFNKSGFPSLPDTSKSAWFASRFNQSNYFTRFVET